MLFLASVLWSFSGVAVKLAQVEPAAFAAVRSLGAGVACSLLLLIHRRPVVWPATRLMLPTAVVHAVMVGSLIAALTFASAAEGILLQYTGPLWCAAFGSLLFGRRVRRALVLPMMLALLGVAVTVLGGPIDPLGSGFGILSGAAYGLVIVMLDRLNGDRPGLDVVAVVAINNLASVALLLPAAWLLADGSLTPGRLAFVLGVGVVQMAVPYVLFQRAIPHVGPVAASLLVLAEPVLNPTWAWLLAGDVPPTRALIGGALILAAVTAAALAPRPRTG